LGYSIYKGTFIKISVEQTHVFGFYFYFSKRC